MKKFKEQLRMIEEALLKPMSDERENEVDAEKLKIRLDDIKRYATLNEDGSYDVEGNVDLSYMNLTKLPMKFGKISGSFTCVNNELTNLEGGPREVGGGFYCSYNKLISLVGGPINVKYSFSCSDNKLTSLEGAPKEVGGDFYCYANMVEFTISDVRAICAVIGDINV